jgi:RNA recognition motif-containing protein|tara:strand:+ start:329 stop:577 length:249 start_codon:yes stop_codon:yes gene_type:complete
LNIFVGNLNFRTSEEELQAHFEQFGPVTSARIIQDRATQRSRGFGFVEMENSSDGEKAISELNGKEFNGRELRVNVAQQKRY